MSESAPKYVRIPVVVDALALFVEPARPGDFVVAKRVAMSTTSQPADAT